MASFTSLIFISLSCLIVSMDANGAGFSVDLIHRDSPKSPFYNPKETSAERMGNTFRRSMNRVCHFSRLMSVPRAVTLSAIEEEMKSNDGSFLMSMSIGTPRKLMYVLVDTGSDLTWTHCTPCPKCPKPVDPLFDPKSSSTYKDLNCASRECQISYQKSTCPSSGICQFKTTYEDGSFSKGNLAVETVTLNSTSGRPVSFPKTVFGCSHSTNETTGIAGLGGGRHSLIRQMGASIDGKFSYCMIPVNSTTDRSSTIKFGRNAIVSGKGVQSTPLIPNKPETFYFLTLEAISIESNRIKFPGSLSSKKGNGNIIIDSGTTVTALPQKFYDDIASAVDSFVGGKKVKDPQHMLELCYAANSVRKVPQVIAHFKGADVKLHPSAVLTQVTDDGKVLCFPFQADKSVSIFGNIQQSNFLIGYDLVKQTVSFKSTDCTKA